MLPRLAQAERLALAARAAHVLGDLARADELRDEMESIYDELDAAHLAGAEPIELPALQAALPLEVVNA